MSAAGGGTSPAQNERSTHRSGRLLGWRAAALSADRRTEAGGSAGYDRDVPLPRALGRFNRRVTNPLLGPIVTRLPGFGWIVHRGRRSGRTYRTPVLAFTRGDRVVIALTYGPATDWVKNVLAAGGCKLEKGSQRVDLHAPRLFHDRSRRAAPPLIRPALWLLGAADFLELRVSQPVGTRIPS